VISRLRDLRIVCLVVWLAGCATHTPRTAEHPLAILGCTQGATSVHVQCKVAVFTATHPLAETIVAVRWTWGDRSARSRTSTGDALHQFPGPGTYRIGARLRLADRREASAFTTVVIP
jgi:hypothetical protein